MHIMLDLETLDTGGRSVVTAIGAVAFDPYARGTGSTFYAELTDDLAFQQRLGRTISGDTVVWWMRQGQAAQQLFQLTDSDCRINTLKALDTFTGFVEDHGGAGVEMWGNGADFDNVILGSLYEDAGLRKPWSYSRNRCFRTMKSLRHPRTIVRPARVGTHHNALDDAVTQALHLQAIYAALYPKE